MKTTHTSILGAVLVVAALSAAAPVLAGDDDPIMTPENVLNKVLANRLGFRTIVARATMMDIEFMGQPRGDHKTLITLRRRPERWYVEFAGWKMKDGRWERTGTTTAAGDRKTCRFLKVDADGATTEARVEESEFCGFDKWDEYLWDPVGYGSSWVGSSSSNSTTSLDAETGLWTLERRYGEDQRHCIVVDPARGWFPVRHTVLLTNREGREVAILDAVSEDFRQVGDGLWAPYKQTVTGQSFEPGSRTVVEYVFDEVTVNGDIPDGDLSVAFPFGTKVRDCLSGTTYYAEVRPTIIKVLCALLAVVVVVWFCQRSRRRAAGDTALVQPQA